MDTEKYSMPTFILYRNDKVIGSYVINKRAITIGRSRDNTIAIANKAISRRHARIDLLDEGYILSDAGSLNGTFLNDQRTQRAQLAAGDKISIGSYSIQFEIDAKRTGPALPEKVAPAADDASAQDEISIQETGSSPAPQAAMPAIPATNPPIKPPEPPSEGIVQQQPQTRSAEVISLPVAPQNRQLLPNQPSTDTFSKKDATGIRETKGIALEAGPVTLEEKVKAIIAERAFLSEQDIRKRLGDPDFGKTKVSSGALHALLKNVNLDTPARRYGYYVKS
jgi:pSer/pThr/pTyr-binding forkhead associated (FHA) protein